MNDRLLTKYEVMETLKISRKHFEKLVKEKELSNDSNNPI